MDIVPSMEGQVCKQFQHVLEKQKMQSMFRIKVASVGTSGDLVKLTLEPAASGEQSTLEADLVLVSAGVRAIDDVIPGFMLTHKAEEEGSL